jgi:hypothetical protein
MPPRIDQAQGVSSKPALPSSLRFYEFYGVELNSYVIGEDECRANCPFCGREQKFSINSGTGLWRCLVCGGGRDTGGGSQLDFLWLLWEESEKATTPADYSELALDRGLERPETLIKWGLARSILTDQWLIPGWGLDHHGKLKLNQLYQYVQSKGRRLLMVPKDTKHQLIGLPLYEEVKPNIYLCEGPWDAMRLFEVLSSSKTGPNGALVETATADRSLLCNANVLAVPGCNTFSDSWTRWFKDKHTHLMYDSDHVKKNTKTGADIPPAGWLGMKMATARLSNAADEISYLDWGPEGFDPAQPSGYDVRDSLRSDPLRALPALLERLQPVPDDWIEPAAVASSGGEVLECRPCSSWSALSLSWRKALKWTDGLDHGLTCMLAAIASTNSIGDQLWFKIIGPPSCGKSTLAEALAVNRTYVKAKSTIRGFHSGWRTMDGEDAALIDELRGKALVTKDGDTLLQSPNLGQILSEARDLYDSVSRTHYRSQMSKDYEGVRWVWILCGTSSLRKLDQSELGARFLDCVIMDTIDADLEDEILWRVVNKSAAHVDIEADGTANSQHAPELVSAMELTGGYINWLRENASKLLPNIEFDDSAKRECVNIGKFTAYMRCRPSKMQAEKAERELAARLVAQHTRLAKCMALVLNRGAVDEVVMGRVRRVGLDTSRGIILDLVKALYEAGERGMEYNGLQIHTSVPDGELRGSLLPFMRSIGIIDQLATAGRKAWRLSKTVRALYKHVVLNQYPVA